jgi:SNF2 family DNA or RNA helicase
MRLVGHSKMGRHGTPIQSRVGDLAALLKFIRAYPYDDIRQFDAEIGKVWKTGDVEEAAKSSRSSQTVSFFAAPRLSLSCRLAST